METSRYRREYAAYCSARERALYESYAGATNPSQLNDLRERHADLWTRDAINELERARAATPETFETERAALLALANAARLGYAHSHAREATDELSRCEAASRVEWNGERLSLREARARVVTEMDAAARRELIARWLEASRACDDLRAARLAQLNSAARELDFDSCAALAASATNTDSKKLLDAADLLLARTAAAYDSRLNAWAARHLPHGGARSPDLSDEFALVRLAQLDKFFPSSSARTAFEATTRGLGLRDERQTNIRVEELTKDRVSGGAKIKDGDAKIGDADARAFGVSPPADVRLAFHARAGADFHRKFFYEAARAQHFAWASRETATRYPEFVHAPDRATSVGFGSLFRALFTDRAWLTDIVGARPSDAEEIARTCALVELRDVRRACARVRDELELLASDEPRAESLAESCAARRRDATGFQHPTALLLFELTEESAFETVCGCTSAAETLRGRLFAASLGEYLRTRYGSRWWSRRAAGDALVDLWNTASRYTVEELAPLAGAGALDAELLSETLKAQVS